MKLPNLSHMLSVGQLRYIQSTYESAEYRNPDVLVGELLPLTQRWRCNLRGRMLLSRLRSRPFYAYVLARTIYYDQVFLDAISERMEVVVNVGAGSDTRAYRFGHLLGREGIAVWECDQPAAIRAKREIARRTWPTGHLEYLSLDLDDGAWPELERRLRERRGAAMLVMLEGVSPYVRADSFERFLDLLASELGPRSSVAYDFKRPGIDDSFGRSDGAAPFRLAASRAEVVAFHERHGFEVRSLESSEALTARVLPDAARLSAAPFDEDALVRLSVSGRSR